MKRIAIAISMFCLFVLPATGQDSRIVRKWQGALGHSQFGVFSKDGSRLVYAAGNDVVIVDAESGENSVTLTGHEKPVWLARFSTDDKRVVSVGQDDTIRIWDTETHKQISSLDSNTADKCSVLVVNKDAKVVAFSSGADRQLKVIGTVKNQEVQRIGLTESEDWWYSVSPDLKAGLAGGFHNGAAVREFARGDSIDLATSHHNYCGQFAHDGAHALLGGGFSWDLWNVRSKTKVKAGVVTGGHVYAVATSPNSSRFLTGLADGTVWVWDIKTGKEITVLRSHSKAVDAAMMSPDKKLAVSVDKEGEIILWRLP